MSTQGHRVVFLNRSYWPDIEATGQLLADLCGGLKDHFDVHVVCGQPNRPEVGSDFAHRGTERHEGVTIHRLAHRQFNKKNAIGRILNLLSFYRATDHYLSHSRLNADLVVSETDPFLLPIAGARFAKRVAADHVVYLQDIYPDVADAVGKSRVPMVSRFIRGRLKKTYSNAARVVVLGHCMRARLVSKSWNIPDEKIEVIPNWADCERIQPIPHERNEFRRRLGLEDSFVVMHSGNMGLTQRLEVLLQAAGDAHWPARAKLLLVGNGASRDRLIHRAKQMYLPQGRIQFLDYQPRNELAQSLSAADVHVVSMHESITGCLCPSKLYGIMAAGRSVIAIADPNTDLCQMINRHDLGWCVQPGSAIAIAKAVAEAERKSIQKLHRICDCPIAAAPEQNHRARDAAIRGFDRTVIVRQFSRLLTACLSDRCGGSRFRRSLNYYYQPEPDVAIPA